MRTISIYGTGIRSYGYEPDLPGSVIATFWLSVLFVPLVPLRRAKCRYVGESTTDPNFDTVSLLDEVERLPISLLSITKTYSLAIAAIIVALGPVAVMLVRFHNRAATFVEFVLTLLFSAWPVGVIILLEKREREIMEATWTTDHAEAVAAARMASKRFKEEQWSRSHVLPEWLLLCSLAVGMVPGFVIARWQQWGANVEVIFLLASAGLAAGVVAMADRVLVYRRRARERLHEEQVGTALEPSPLPLPDSAERRRLLARIGDINDFSKPRPLVSLEEFFEGNDDRSSIGYNLSDQPTPAEFYKMLRTIRDQPEVANVVVEVKDIEDPDGWPSTDTIWIVSSLPRRDLELFVPDRYRPDDWIAYPPEHAVEMLRVPIGMNAIGMWHD
ncbi:MAG TPA: hypothetical protein VMM76_21645 [Pirellulaceae bacterium]|nr:hypothetical protein [Pirellulaceae bacterium]